MFVKTLNVVRSFDKDEVINFPKGRISILVGNNGSGKSTLLRLIYNNTNPNIEKLGEVLEVYGFVGGAEVQLGRQYDYVLGYDQHLGSVKTSKSNPVSLGLKDVINSHFQSSGEADALALLTIIDSAKDNTLMLLDEPDRGLSVSSSVMLLAYLTKYLTANPLSTVIMSVHSRAVVEYFSEVLCLDNMSVEPSSVYLHRTDQVPKIVVNDIKKFMRSSNKKSLEVS